MITKTPGAHKVELHETKHELFAITKAAMKKNPKLYQFSSIEKFEDNLTIKYPCEIYIWNNEKGELIGYLGHVDLNKKEDELLIIVIHPDFQKQGYGTKMMNFYFKLIKTKEKSILSTHEKNTRAIQFYQSMGYEFVKFLPNQYDDGQTRILLEKNF